MTIESILGLALPIIGGVANSIVKDTKPTTIVERVEVKERESKHEPVVHSQQNQLFTPIAQPPVTVNFNLNIYINGKKGENNCSEVTIDM